VLESSLKCSSRPIKATLPAESFRSNARHRRYPYQPGSGVLKRRDDGGMGCDGSLNEWSSRGLRAYSFRPREYGPVDCVLSPIPLVDSV
jgi:hypothetical protein